MADSDKTARVLDLLKGMDKPMFQSKKYTALLLFSTGWKILLAYGIYAGMSDTILLGMIGGATTVESLGNSLQAWHDKHKNRDRVNAMNGSVSAAVAALSQDEPADQSSVE